MRVVVCGAGFAGLAAADALRSGGADVVVLEARDRVGGRVWSVPFGEAVVERGAEFVMPADDTVREFCTRLGLTLYDKKTPYGDREPRGIGDVSRVEIAQAAARASRAVASDELTGTVTDTLAGLDLDRGAREALRARIEVSTAYPAEDLAATALSEGATQVGGFATHGVDGGNQLIAERLATFLGGAVRLSSPVERIAWSSDGVAVRAGGVELEADGAVVAVPASVIDKISFEPALPPDKLGALKRVRYGQAAKLFVGLTRPAAPSATLAVSERFWAWTQEDAEGRPLAVAACFAGSPSALERLGVDEGPGAWIAALSDHRPDLCLDPNAVLLSTWRDDPWVEAAYSARSFEAPLDEELLARRVGPLAFAGEHTAGAWHGLMEGALRSGVRAAADILDA